MEILDRIFSFLNKKTSSDGKFYLVGGSTRDYLLKREFDDFDFATTLSPAKLRIYFKDVGNFAFIKYGIVNIKFEGKTVTLACMRKETSYLDSRHPSKLEFINDLNIDCKRRDFTINSIYLDSNYEIYDPNNGLEDLKSKTIRMIGDYKVRIKEDPLRILRCLRFAYALDFEVEKELKEFIFNNLNLLKNLKECKIKEELSKFRKEDLERLKKETSSFIN